jgi:hypothetical protein
MERGERRGLRVRSVGLAVALLASAAVGVPAHASTRAAAAPTPFSPRWTKRYDAATADDAAHALAVSPDGSAVFVTGYSVGKTGGANYLTTAYRSTDGTLRWARRYDGSEHTGDVSRAIAVSPDGTRVFITGRSHGALTGDDYATIAYDASTGDRLWVSRFTGPRAGDDEATSLAVSPDGGTLYVTGHSHGTGTGADYATLAYDVASGAQRWVTRYNAPAGGDDAGLAIGVSPGGTSVYVTGRTETLSTGIDGTTVAYVAATGAQRWVRSYDGPGSGDDVLLALGVAPDGGRVFVAGQSLGTGSGVDFVTIAYATGTGADGWNRRYDGPAGNKDGLTDLAVTPNGLSVVVTGGSRGTGSASDYATVAYAAAAGTQRWVRRYDGPPHADDVATSLEPSAASTFVSVTGHSHGAGTGDDYATVTYGLSSGTLLRSARYDGPAHASDVATGVGVAPGGGTVYVTGRSTASATAYDFATQALE